jgi:phosphoglycerol transferase MdoB-like AlkP superfamily enzyme
MTRELRWHAQEAAGRTRAPSAGVGRRSISQRIRPLLVLGAVGLLVPAGFRLALLVLCRDALGGVAARDVARCLLLGIGFDGFALGLVGLPLAVALSAAPNLAFGLAWFRRTIAAYVTVLVAAMLFLEIAGTFFFLQFGLRLNGLVLDDLQAPREVLTYIWEQYPVAAVLLGTAVLGAGLYRALMWLFWRGPRPSLPAWPRRILGLLLCGVCVLGIGDSLHSQPLHLGRAYEASDNAVVTQLALNNIYNLVEAARPEEANRLYPLPAAARAAEVTRGMLLQPQDTDLAVPGDPLRRRTATGWPQTDYNVVVILMEGMAGQPVGALGHSPSHTPHLDALCQEGLFFDRLYAVGSRTNRGLVGCLCGYPDLGEQSIMLQSHAPDRFPTLPGILKARGYRTLLVYSGRTTWDNARGFFGRCGIEEFLGQEDWPDEPEVNAWGVSDEATFRKAHERFLRYGDRKFFAAILTITNHPPYTAPPGRVKFLPGDSPEVRKLNCYRYADGALGEFFRLARQADYFKRTIFVLVADHGRDLASRRLLDVPGFRVPCVIYAPGIVPPGRVSTVASQTDIAPTVLSLLGGEFEHGFLGRDLLAARSDEGCAVLHLDRVLALVRDDRAVVLRPNAKPRVFRVGPTEMEPVADDAAVLEEQTLSCYSIARRLYLDARAGPGNDAAPLPVAGGRR